MQGPSTLGQLAWFLIITLIYSYLDYSIRVGTSDGKEAAVAGKLSVYMTLYLLLAVIGQYFITVSASTVLCGAPQYYSSLFATFFPWVFIFGTMIAMLTAFPGWVLPLSNTIGYLCANGMGMGKLANDVFNKPSDTEEMTDTLKKALSHIYTDKASLLNNITPSNFADFWKESESLRKTPLDKAADIKKKFRDFVILKHAIGTITWYLLTGALVISVSYNYIANSPCSSSVSQIAGDAEKIQKKQNELQQHFPTYKTTE
tara:strand:+ start:6923 stop:7699 length:777 start_codon:yes stop_codon:yes gene_type:complete